MRGRRRHRKKRLKPEMKLVERWLAIREPEVEEEVQRAMTCALLGTRVMPEPGVLLPEVTEKLRAALRAIPGPTIRLRVR